jgi:hypothetical protein
MMSQPQQPSYYPSPPAPHTHGNFIGAIIAVGLVALIVGLAVGFDLTSYRTADRTVTVSTPQFTFTHGTVNISPNSGTPVAIYFDNQYTGTLTGVITSISGVSNSFQLYLPINRAYQVTVYYSTTFSSWQHCNGRPSPFTTSGSDYTQDFLCS